MSGETLNGGTSPPDRDLRVVEIYRAKKPRRRMSAPNDAEGGAPPAPDVFDKEPRDDDADSDKVVEEGGEVAPRGELDEIFKFCVCQDQRAAGVPGDAARDPRPPRAPLRSSNLDVDVAQLDKDQPFYFPEEYKYSGAVFCYDTELWRPKQSDSRDVFSSMGPQNPTRDPHDPVIHEADDEA